MQTDSHSWNNLEGKTALVFGVRNDASLAWATAQLLHSHGCQVAVSYLPDTRTEVLALLTKSGMDATLAAEADVRSEEQVQAFVSGVAARTGGIDFVLHAVAYGNHRVMCSKAPGSTEEPGDFLQIPFKDFMESFDISAYSLLRICRCAAPHLRGAASIVTLTYNASQRVLPAYAGMAINKAALENLTQYLAHYFGGRGIRVNAISAGLVMTTSAAGIAGVRKLRKLSRELSPLGNVSSQDVAKAALYYFSDLSLKATGNIHYVDGGINIMGSAPDADS